MSVQTLVPPKTYFHRTHKECRREGCQHLIQQSLPSHWLGTKLLRTPLEIISGYITTDYRLQKSVTRFLITNLKPQALLR